MNKHLLYLLTAFLFLSSCLSNKDKVRESEISSLSHTVKIDTSLNGLYIGLEYLQTSRDPAYPGKIFKVYHLGHLKIKGDSVFLDQSPIFVNKKDTTYSASDGGFYYYSGSCIKTDTTVSFDLTELFCDYCAVRVQTKPDGTQYVAKRTKQLKGRLTKEGFIIDGYLYAKTEKEEVLTSEHPERTSH